jgi:hypothetical protein
MPLTPAERVARSRRHTRGDHTLCDPLRCEDRAAGRMATAPIPTATAPPVVDEPDPWIYDPIELGPRGRALRDELAALPGLAPGDMELVEEAARIADRLDVLARVLRGEDHPWLVTQLDLRKNLLGEARQQATTLKTLLEKLQGKQAAKSAASEPESSTLDELTKRRAERLSRAANS